MTVERNHPPMYWGAISPVTPLYPESKATQPQNPEKKPAAKSAKEPAQHNSSHTDSEAKTAVGSHVSVPRTPEIHSSRVASSHSNLTKPNGVKKVHQIKLVIPEDINKKYNNALSRFENGKNTLIGYHQQLHQLTVLLSDPETPSVMLLGEQGIGKTALVEQWLYNLSLTERPAVVVQLSLETLGELGENMMASRIRSLLSDMREIKSETEKVNPGKPFSLALFIDEVHKLHDYGTTENSSSAMNALKEGTARGQFPIITATTDYEYRTYLVKDKAFDRRFHKIIMQQPDHHQVIQILKWRINSYKKKGQLGPDVEVSDEFLEELTHLTDSFIRNQVNPAKSIAILSACVAYHVSDHKPFDHDALVFAFDAEGINIESLATAAHVRNVIQSQIKGQPLAVRAISNAINLSFYSQRDLKKPMMTIFAVGTTGTGKSATAKALAEAFFGRRDAMVVLNGGDYSTPEDARRAQTAIGDAVAVNKQQLILLDEIEKMSRNAQMGLMRVIDEGIAVDSNGVDRSINNTILMATSNLAKDIFADLADSMHLARVANPDKLTKDLVDKWSAKEMTVRSALQEGDANMNNGIRPEFLERFTLLVPYMPLARLTMARIARKQLLDYQAQMRQMNYDVKIPAPHPDAYWKKMFHDTANTYHYGGLDSISVMIAEDIISSQAGTIGARAIERYIDTEVKTSVANTLADRDNAGLGITRDDGAVFIKTNGNASWESPGHNQAGIVTEFKTVQEQLEVT